MRIRHSIPSFAVAVLLCSAPRNFAATMDDFCAIVTKGRQDLAALSKRVSAESNPLKQDAIQQQYSPACRDFNAKLNAFVQQNSMQNWHGTVQSMQADHFNNGPGFWLYIRLDCSGVEIPPVRFLFIDVTNPEMGRFNPEYESSLARWKPVLETLAINDRISWSGTFSLQPTLSYPLNLAQPPESGWIAGVVTNLSKGDELHEVAPSDSSRGEGGIQNQTSFPGERFPQTQTSPWSQQVKFVDQQTGKFLLFRPDGTLLMHFPIQDQWLHGNYRISDNGRRVTLDYQREMPSAPIEDMVLQGRDLLDAKRNRIWTRADQ